MPLRIAIVDDHALFRQGLRALLSTANDLEVVAEASEAREAYRVVDESRPDVVTLDLSLPGSDGLAVLRELRRRAAGGRVLVLSMHTSNDYVRQAFSAGATGYAVKDQHADEIIDAIRTVARGHEYLSPRFPRSLLDQRTQPDSGPFDDLSAREREIFDLLLKGFSTQGVAAELCISPKTVETHRSHINKKLSVHSTAELIRLAARHGLIAP